MKNGVMEAGSTLGMGCGAKEAITEKEVQAQLNILDRSLVELGMQVNGLVDRLKPVLRSTVPCPLEDCDKVEKELVPIAHHVRTVHAAVTKQCAFIRDIIDLLEV